MVSVRIDAEERWCFGASSCGCCREVLKEDESGSLKASVEEILFQSKRRRCVCSSLSSPAAALVVFSPACSLVLQAGAEPWTSQAGDGELLLWPFQEPCSLVHMDHIHYACPPVPAKRAQFSH